MLFAERITDPVTDHGEGPFWDELHGRLLCVDALAGAIVAIGDSGETERHQLPTSVLTVVRRRSSGGYVLATDREVAVVNDEFLDFEAIAQFTGDPKLRANDGGCDPFGNFVVGTMAYDERAEGGPAALTFLTSTPRQACGQIGGSTSTFRTRVFLMVWRSMKRTGFGLRCGVQVRFTTMTRQDGLSSRFG